MGVTELKRPLIASSSKVSAGVNVTWQKTGFRPGPLYHSGVLDLCPPWFQAAHTVSPVSCFLKYFCNEFINTIHFRDCRISFMSQVI